MRDDARSARCQLSLAAAGLTPASPPVSLGRRSMGISESVGGLASALAAHLRGVTPRDPILVVYLAEIGAMPLWRDMGALDQWEERVKRHPIDRETRKGMQEPFSNLAEEIFGLGCYNLYGHIAAGQTKAEFERVRHLLLRAGVSNVPQSSDFDFAVW